MSQHLSFAAILGLVLVAGYFLFRVLEPFLLPLSFAAVLAVLFQPFYHWTIRLCRGHGRVAAALATAGIIGGVMLPLTAVTLVAGYKLAEAGQELVESVNLEKGATLQEDLDRLQERPWLQQIVRRVRPYLSEKNIDAMRATAASTVGAITKTIYERTLAVAANVATFLIGLVIMALALYYFFADGQRMLDEARRLSPLQPQDEQFLFQRFVEICRGVVLGTVMAAAVEGALAGVGYALAGVGYVWLLAPVTMLCAFLPVVGAAAVWGVLTIVLLFEGNYGAAIFLAVYSSIVVSGADHLVRVYVIQGRTHLHPMVAIVTILGGIHVAGLWGIFFGPMVAVFFHALLSILRPKLGPKDEPDAADGNAAAS